MNDAGWTSEKEVEGGAQDWTTGEGEIDQEEVAAQLCVTA